jgi:hypothetical protein
MKSGVRRSASYGGMRPTVAGSGALPRPSRLHHGWKRHRCHRAADPGTASGSIEWRVLRSPVARRCRFVVALQERRNAATNSAILKRFRKHGKATHLPTSAIHSRPPSPTQRTPEIEQNTACSTAGGRVGVHPPRENAEAPFAHSETRSPATGSPCARPSAIPKLAAIRRDGPMPRAREHRRSAADPKMTGRVRGLERSHLRLTARRRGM